ncbi:MFS transporter [Aspergillus novofumigatus IBT 16806]|uniref:Putative MFS transporter n=1 Tax=Aspergillus novofumigatus (strain IBT 16806) TaxID=1392255 RepID=A0A2I1C6E9_ASPN1|nr:putative MFS transporter [Aspergillus novofumigatus IBT 16806]PKX93204.1 putative MFS transporter [Aspergillus novofumigatus IBT 16806]
MDSLSRDLEKAELEAYRAPSRSQSLNHGGRASRSDSLSSSVTSSSSSTQAQEGDYYLSQIQTAQTLRGAGLERHPTALSRIATQRSQHSATVGALKPLVSKKPLAEFGAGKPYPPPLPEREEYVVEFAGPDDPLHPQNWSIKKKIAVSAMLAYTTFNATFTSSIYSTANSVVSSKFHVSTEVGTLGLSLYVLGFACGPTFFSPLSELQGRRLPILIGMFGFTVFQFAVATAENLQTVIICRFFGGFFGSCPIAVVAAVFSDIYDNRHRGLAITVFTMAVFTGPLFAPFIGGFIVESYLGWRWTEYLTGIMGASAFVLDLFFLEETYPPVVLIGKAAELRRRTRNWGIHAKQEEIEVEFGELIRKNFSRPLRILFTEPIVLLLSIYMAFLYGLLYLFLTAYPIVFQRIHGFNKGPWYNRRLSANKDIPIPEWRLPPAIIGGVAFSGGLFWFGWSGYRSDIHWIVPTLSGLLTGFGLFCIFLQCLNYIVDAYLVLYDSHFFQPIWYVRPSLLLPLSGASFRSLTCAQFNALGVNWTGTLLGCVAAILMPIPLLFYLYGPKIREESKFAMEYIVAAQAHNDEHAE